ncbi:prolyl aminopeptidase [Bacteriovorax sp. DB6_IX]|uniref:prolyl aminopeptidase n=1 Tax=Bacteriovorax sp. DB6_IX TaxID=1353530 RepID=UPI00038A0182|nr:prolyl aminopeptidase [Bacteriovorax sp. DB6_IX]EQC48403.1 prolyl aminopeptidase [Bacteriovorax sp. DB6_IX]
MNFLYPEIEPFNTGYLKVSQLHEIYFEQCGNPNGEPVIFLHGGPGGGLQDNYRRYFDPKRYHIILFDQRGCGKSKPFAELRENTTWDLVSDIEKIREELSISKWAVFGGSWGSTLALAYAQSHPDSVSALYLRGIFMLRKKELRWFYQEGASFLYPDAWEKYIAPIPEEERDDFISAFYKRLTSEDQSIRSEAAKAWAVWEASTSKIFPDTEMISKFSGDKFSEAFARIECHYFINGGFLESENQLLDNVDKIRHIPTVIVQGRYDIVCPPQTAWELHKKWPEAEFIMVQDAGHSLSEKGITQALVSAVNK